jgi:hypothetical protein
LPVKQINHDFARSRGKPRRLCAMTQGERAFYLREIHGHWTTTAVSSEKLGELAQAKLIEVQAGHLGVVRLTSAGERCKIGARSHYQNSLPLSRSRSRTAASRSSRPPRARDVVLKPKPLV